jgi:hypothetical protein
MHFAYSPRVEEMRRRLGDFMDNYVLPRVPDYFCLLIFSVPAVGLPPQQRTRRSWRAILRLDEMPHK